MNLPVVLGHPDARPPARAHSDDAGLDLRSIESVEIPPGERRRVRTGLRLAIPPGHAGLVLPRSGLALRAGLTLLNSPGLIDPGYRGDVDVIAHNTDLHEPVRIGVGDRIAQLMLVRLAELEPTVVAELPPSERDEGGFGSTDQSRLCAVHEPPRLRVSAVLHRGTQVLLVRHRKNDRDYWLLPGGGVEGGEQLEDALRRELREECDLDDIHPVGPIALAETIAPLGSSSRRHIVHLIFEAALPESIAHVASLDPAVANHRLFELADLGDVDLRPPIHRFLSRWQPGDPFVPLGPLWSA